MRSPLVLVLVEPAGPLNVGSVARLAANFGIQELRLVAPRCNHLGEEALRMAVHGRWILEQASLYGSLAEAIADCRRVVASTGRAEATIAGMATIPPLQTPEQGLGWLLAADPTAPAALVCGREDRGLSNDELLQAGRLVRIGTEAAYPSLNLSHAVAVLLHELQRARAATSQANSEPNSGPNSGPKPAAAAAPNDEQDPCPRGDLEAALADAEALLLEAGFLYPHTAHARMAKLRGLLQRAQARRQDVALIRGMVRQLRWASQHKTT
ncbi:MAG: TrmJ/YjtD family RNA methyltransferase [Prochlorococcaceae cyanobacterium]